MRHTYIGFKNAKSNTLFTIQENIFNSQKNKFIEVKKFTDADGLKLYTARSTSSMYGIIYGMASPIVVKIYETHPFFNIGLIADRMFWNVLRPEAVLHPIIKPLKRDVFKLT